MTDKDYKLIEKLLELLDKYGSKYFQTGLCLFIEVLCNENLIDDQLFNKLDDLLSEIPPKNKDVFDFWFKRGNIAIRKKYLKGLLNTKKIKQKK